jgi:hypothetical protein
LTLQIWVPKCRNFKQVYAVNETCLSGLKPGPT